jgi:cellulose synthase/poly-beta-1,6-N-acetylglucosamine synthase-like glycosyltransferase
MSARRWTCVALLAAAAAAAVVMAGPALLDWRARHLLPAAGTAALPLRVAVLACLVYLVVINVLDGIFVLVAVRENDARLRESRAEDYRTIATSRFTIPVSVVAPMHNEAVLARPVVDSLLALDYPEFEVIVVNDGSTDETLEILRGEYGLEPVARFPRKVFETGTVVGVYRSATHARLTVVDKESRGAKADALNCGLNHARYRYVCSVDGDTIYEPDALLRSMRPVLRDPARVIAVTSQIVVSAYPEDSSAGALVRSPLILKFQHLEYLRAFLNDRLAWSRLNFMHCMSGAFMLCRRDALEEAGGFSNDFSCEDIELTFRLHERFLRLGRPYRIVALPEPVGRTEGPTRLSSLILQRSRWQRVMVETAWHYRRMFLNPRYGRLGLLGMPFLVVSEVLAPFVEVLALATLAVAALFGLVVWSEWALLLGVMSFANAALTVAAIGLDDVGTRAYRLRDLAVLMLLAPLEIVLYKPPLFWAHLQGLVGFFRGDKRWIRFDRNERTALQTSV